MCLAPMARSRSAGAALTGDIARRKGDRTRSTENVGERVDLGGLAIAREADRLPLLQHPASSLAVAPAELRPRPLFYTKRRPLSPTVH